MFDGEVLIVGLGSIGERHVRNLLELGHEDITVLRRAPESPRTLDGDEYETVTDADEAFGSSPAAVIVATPTALHDEPLRRGIQAGADVLVEVPLSADLEGVGEIRRTARDTGSQVLLGHNLRFHPALERIRKAVQDGTVGEPLFLRSQFGEYLPGLHTWEDYQDRYEARSDLGGGAVRTSIHEIDNAYWLLGPVEAATCVARTLELDVDVEDVAMMALEHESGQLSEIELDFLQRTYRRNLQVAGTSGTIEWELLGDRVRCFDADEEEWRDLLVLEDYDINETYLDELRHFNKVVEDGVQPRTDLDDAIHVLRAGLAALRASKEERRVPLKEVPVK